MGQTSSIDDILARVREEARRLAQEAGPGAAPASPDVARRLSAPVFLPQPEVPTFAMGRLVALLVLSDDQYIGWAYQVALGRRPDEVGLRDALAGLRAGVSRLRFLQSLIHSEEGRRRGAHVKFLRPMILAERVLGRGFTLAIALYALPASLRFFNQTEQALLQSHRELIGRLNGSLRRLRDGLLEIDKRASFAEQTALTASESSAAAERSALSAHDASAKAVADLGASRLSIIQQTEALRQLIERTHLGEGSTANVDARDIRAITDRSRDDLYVAIENHFRGSPELIASRAKRYLPLFDHAPEPRDGVVLDLGCGRGEWLSLLKQHGIAARGVDLNEVMVAHCKSLELDAEAGNAITTLQGLPTNSLAAVTAFHLVEHLSFEDLVTLFDEALRVLRPPGFILFETPNPENLVVGACNFYYDPTHRHPLPPQLLRMIAEARGFAVTRIVRNDADCRLDANGSSFDPKQIEDWFKQPMDYALYARKSGASPEKA